ncbi:hypothetical protein BHF68_04535 [Desulfuribacillus alkaliarsenatis]|uniref:ABC transmembrane type-1 domain-containing protein n=2 Tax=Desulfuribacillus alkaliarsenatis TaxID=766136 RepID=A0A1E5G3G1_9FIRM|nr:hypothetical protein BHF68_04535 [Desulfuribacillus alkaliarsenatis]
MRLSATKLQLLPGILFVVVIVGYGVVSAFVESVSGGTGVGESWTLEHYQRLIANDVFWESFIFSIKVTSISTLISLFIGVIIARTLYQCFISDYAKLLTWVPMLIPHFVAAYMVILLFSPSGWFSSIGYQLGLIEYQSQFPILVMDRAGIGIILAYIWKQVPFVVLMVLPVYYQLDKRYLEVARTLGSNKRQVFFTVEWPWLYPVVIEVGIILFAFIIAAFEIPYLLGSTFPKMLSVVTYQWFYEGSWSQRPLAMAAMSLLTVMILFVSFLALFLLQKSRYRMMKGL